MDSITDDCLLHIFSFLEISDLCNVRLVCKRFLQIYENDNLWQLYAINRMKILECCEDSNAFLTELQKEHRTRCIVEIPSKTGSEMDIRTLAEGILLHPNVTSQNAPSYQCTT